MKKFRLIFWVLLFLAYTNIVVAQDSPFRFGVNAGINLSNAMIGTAVSNGSSYRTGYQVGFTVDYAFSKKINLLSGLSFISKGSKIEDLNYTDYVGGSPDFTHKFEQQYIQLPLYGAYKFKLSDNFNLMIGIGPYFAYGIGGKTKEILNNGVWSDGITEREYKTFKSSEVNYSNEVLKRFDFGLGALINLEYKRFNLNIGYEQGVANISRSDSYKYRNSSLTFSIGYKY